jgi:hypothetical protein
MTKRTTNAKTECKKAYEEFNPNPILMGVKLECIPPKPHYTHIDNYGLPKKDRKFKPLDIPKIEAVKDSKGFIVSTKFEGLSTQEEDELLSKITQYRREGYWFFNGDKLEYISGDHFYYLNFCKIPIVKRVYGKLKRVNGSPHFVDADRNFFNFWKHCNDLDNIFGMLFVSSRRSGKSYKSIAIILNAGTSVYDACLGIQAQNEKMAKSIFGRLKKVFHTMPKHEYFMPQYDTTRYSSGLYFSASGTRSSKGLIGNLAESFNSWIEYRATTETAFDSEGMHIIYKDEVSKMEGLDINVSYEKDRETVAEGSAAVGKILMTTTAENIGGKTLRQFERFKDKCSTKNLNALGQTETGSLYFFQPATMGYRHDPKEGATFVTESTIDEWGYSNEDAARRVIQGLRKNRKGNSLVEFIRKYPLNEAEAFTYGESESPLPLEKIQEQRMFNFDYLKVAEPTVRGTLVWNNTPIPSVRFVPSENGMFQIIDRIREEDLNQITKGALGYEPSRNMCFTGVDPFDHKTTEDSNFSKAAAITICKDPKYFTRPCAVAMYYGRPNDPKILYDDMLKMSVYFSSKMYIENQKPGCVNHFVDEGYTGMLGLDWFHENSKTHGVSTRDPKLKSLLVDRLITYVNDNVGRLPIEGQSIYSEHYFTELLDDWYVLNPDGEAWTKHDLSIATVLALMGLEKPFFDVQDFSFDDLF